MMTDYTLQNGQTANSNFAATGPYAPRARRGASRLSSECVWLDGELVPIEDTAAPVLDPTLRDGPGALEVIRCYLTDRGPAIFRLDAHLQRFLQAARVLGVSDLRYSLLDLRRAVHVTVQVNNLSTCTVRPVLFFDAGRDQEVEGYQPTVAVIAGGGSDGSDWPARPQGVRAIVSSFAREQANRETARDKFDAQRAGYDEAILIDADGFVAGCAGHNLFLVRDEVVYTPLQSGAMNDVARHTAITLLQDSGFRVAESAQLGPNYLYAADEAFLCSSASEVVPIRQIDAHELNAGHVGNVTRALQELYGRTVRGQGRRSRGWLEYVMLEPLF